MNTRNIVVVGAKGVGKSALVHRFINKEFLNEHKETRFSAMKQVTVNENLLHITDTPGYEGASMYLKYLPDNASAVLIVFSVTDKKSFNDLPGLIEKVRKGMQGPIVLIGNKSDLVSERVISKADAERFAKSMDIAYVDASAKNSVDSIFKVALSKIENPSNIIEVVLSEELDALNKNELIELIDETEIKLKNVGKSRVQIRDDALAKCRKADGVEAALEVLKDCATAAQKDHVERSGLRAFGKCGVLFKPMSTTKTLIDEIVVKYQVNPM